MLLLLRLRVCLEGLYDERGVFRDFVWFDSLFSGVCFWELYGGRGLLGAVGFGMLWVGTFCF